ncbi:MAG: Chromosome partition protein smc [Parcubacteria group bacterium Gr01-1014_91]|nr:MAG: Chromosome partition protein smc [Parcubacteria group bacterium Gr01-1014_91]
MLKRLEIVGFKSFAKKTVLDFSNSTTAIVGPNGSGKSNVAEAFRFALGEQSMKSMRGKRAEDLIFNGSHTAPRANRASVAIIFDNSRRTFKIDFDEVSLERAVFRDGTSEYSINGSRVRLRDIEELLAGANIGETGHHIISQGEADRILLANNRERRAMLEDALGLKIYEFKKQEAEKKLVKTEENIAQVNSLRRELAPHLRFLENQVKKLERAEALRAELVGLAQTYFAIEEVYLAREKVRVTGEKRTAEDKLSVSSAELDRIADPQTTDRETTKRTEVLRTAEREVSELSAKRSALARDMGRIEGALTEVKRRVAMVAREPYAKIPREEIEALHKEVKNQVARAGEEREGLKAALSAIGAAVAFFFSRHGAPRDEYLSEEDENAFRLEKEQKALAEKLTEASTALEKAETARERAREGMVALEETGREVRRRILDLAQAKAQAEGDVAKSEAREYELTLLAEELERSKAESVAVGGVATISYEPLSAVPSEERRVQEERKRSLERVKIRLEEAGGTGEEIRQEHKEVSERETFLAKELDDLAKSAAGLRSLIDDLDTELQKHFSEGLAKVNASFGEYFALMFGGGSARLTLEEPEEPDELDEETAEEFNDEPKEKEPQGIEIAVNLPKKKVRSLMQLSGGERALTSIALIFAMSQVNPPPFLILDETDAALDEANSRRYGDMIENLAKRSQLIVITHNRETMSRTPILHGVTMGGDGVSKLLSVKFDEAVAVAK